MGPGTIPLSDLWELLDREGVADSTERETLERLIYHMDHAARKQAADLQKTS